MNPSRTPTQRQPLQRASRQRTPQPFAWTIDTAPAHRDGTLAIDGSSDCGDCGGAPALVRFPGPGARPSAPA